MEFLGFFGAVIGLIAAVINRKRIIIIRRESSYSSPSVTSRPRVTVGKRFKRFLICVGMGFVLLILVGAAGSNGAESLAAFLVLPFFVCAVIAAYQLAAIVLSLLVGLWR